MKLPPLTALRAFEAVARLGSFAAAAGELHVTQSAVSHQIRNLEDWLGRPLLARAGNRTQLLPDGQDLSSSLSQSFGQIESACARIQGRRAALVIAAIPSVAMCWLIPRMARFRAAHPQIETRIVYALHGQEINFADVHLAFVFAKGAPDLPHLNAHFFLSGASAPVCSPALLRDHAPIKDADICRLGLLHDGSTAGWRDWFSGGDGGLLPYPAGPTFEDFNLLRIAALSSQGAALCPLAMVAPDLRAGHLVQLSPRGIDSGFDYYLISAQTTDPQLAAHAQLFCEWALAERASD